MGDLQTPIHSISPLTPAERTAISSAIDCFLTQHIAEGREKLATVRPELYDALYTAGLRLGVEASTLAKASRSNKDKR